MRHINYIYIHCSAGYGDIDSMMSFWKNVLGWKSPGYHIVVDLDGSRICVHPISKPSNGVKGRNHDAVHLSYIGGVEREDYSKAKDTRTESQKAGLIQAIHDVLDELMEYQDVSDIKIQGHRDASPDQNGDGVISSWERIKECPSFDAIPEYECVIPDYLSNIDI